MPGGPDQDSDHHLARQARIAALVVAGTMLFWLGAQALGGALGWPPRFVFLFDFAALAGLFWALVVTVQIWRKRRTARTGGD